MRQAKVYLHTNLVGFITEDESGYRFQYRPEYLQDSNAEAVSLTLPLKAEPYQSNVLFPFFDGLIPEGWLLEIAEKNWKLNPRDRMGLLLQTCADCIGAVSVHPVSDEENG